VGGGKEVTCVRGGIKTALGSINPYHDEKKKKELIMENSLKKSRKKKNRLKQKLQHQSRKNKALSGTLLAPERRGGIAIARMSFPQQRPAALKLGVHFPFAGLRRKEKKQVGKKS